MELCSTLTHLWCCSPRQILSFILTWACYLSGPTYSLRGDAGSCFNLGTLVKGSILACSCPLSLATVFPGIIKESAANLFNLLFIKMYVILGECRQVLHVGKLLIELFSAGKGGSKDNCEKCLFFS